MVRTVCDSLVPVLVYCGVVRAALVSQGFFFLYPCTFPFCLFCSGFLYLKARCFWDVLLFLAWLKLDLENKLFE